MFLDGCAADGCEKSGNEGNGASDQDLRFFALHAKDYLAIENKLP